MKETNPGSGYGRDNAENADVVFQSGRYTLGQRDGRAYLTAGGRSFFLSCHPYEPCLYITDEDGGMTAVHNAFDPDTVLECFRGGGTVTSITGREYGAEDFCRMVEYAAGMYDVQIDDAEKVFGEHKIIKEPKREKKEEKQPFGETQPRPESGRIAENDPVYGLLGEYPDSVIDCRIVLNDHSGTGRNAHRFALLWACRSLFVDDEDKAIWHFNVGKADARLISADELFAPAEKDGVMNYRKAFLCPPYPCGYTDADFDRLNAALFPNGTDGLEVYEWTTDWSDYFDEGHEWWGTLCLTVYDKSLDRFAVIMASATD